MTCPYCDGHGVLTNGVCVYSTARYGNVWVCSNYPECDAYVGCHSHSRRALGTLANANLRKWRNAAHAAFDPLWRSGRMTRREAYDLMAEQLGLTTREAHIAMLDEALCARVVEEFGGAKHETPT